MPAEPLVTLSGVHKRFGAFKALSDISLSVAPGEKVVVCGPSGSGKSTMIRCINGMEPYQQGKITVAGRHLTEEEEVGRAVNVLGADMGLVLVARLAAAAALVGRVHRDGDVSQFRQPLCKEARDLFLDPAVRVRDDDCRIFLLRVVVRRGIDVGGDIQSAQFVFDGVDIDLARLVLRDRAAIGQGKRVLPIVVCQGGAARSADDSSHDGGLQQGAFHV